MMAANYRHIGGLENRLGRHYSRFSASGPAAPLAAQSLARRKSRNGGSNRRSWANTTAVLLPKATGAPRAATAFRRLSTSQKKKAAAIAIAALMKQILATRNSAPVVADGTMLTPYPQ